jgi:hypothetical protein
VSAYGCPRMVCSYQSIGLQPIKRRLLLKRL